MGPHVVVGGASILRIVKIRWTDGTEVFEQRSGNFQALLIALFLSFLGARFDKVEGERSRLGG